MLRLLRLFRNVEATADRQSRSPRPARLRRLVLWLGVIGVAYAVVRWLRPDAIEDVPEDAHEIAIEEPGEGTVDEGTDEQDDEVGDADETSG